MTESDHEDTTREVLESLRKKLLDLTNKNRLINFNHRGKLNIRIIDEMPNQLAETLLSEKEMYFKPVPEPTTEELIKKNPFSIGSEADPEKPKAERWAQHLGLSTDYEMPPISTQDSQSKHTDTRIQTLLYPSELENRLKNILQKADLAIKEMGTNILYLAFGFLEWLDNDDGAPRIAPLFLVPVRLNKGRLDLRTRTYQYTIGYSGEDIISNLSLREKLRVDFQMALPELEDETPEEYFEKAEDMIRQNKPNWKLRRYISLTLLNFSKLRMYLDLNPSGWPKSASIVNHPVVTKIINGLSSEQEEEGNQKTNLHFGEEYSIDDEDNIHVKYPLVYDADSSQHSALIDAVEGKNLVIEGPPGTGKSQTITNLIAAAVAGGKKVLFVAEKLAALEVVHRRLDLSGLGDFCLELHSHKSQKNRVLEDVKIRLKNRGHYRKPEDIDVEIKLYEDRKLALKEHAEQINHPWKNTGRSLHEIFMAATRYRESVRESVQIPPTELHPNWSNGNDFDAIAQSRVKDQVEIFCDTYVAIVNQLDDNSKLQSHPWYGVRNTDLSILDRERVETALKDWQSSLSDLSKESVKLANRLDCVWDEEENSLKGISTLLADLENLPTPEEGNELLDILPILRGNELDEALAYIKQFENIQLRYATLTEKVELGILQNLPAINDIEAGCGRLRQLISHTVDLGTLNNAIQNLSKIKNKIEDMEDPLKMIHNAVGEQAAGHLAITIAGLREFGVFIGLITNLKPIHWSLRNPIFDNDELDELLPLLRRDIENLTNLRSNLEEIFNLDALPSRDKLLQLIKKLNTGGRLRWLKSDWRTARIQALNLAADTRIKLSDLQPSLATVAVFVEQRDQIDNNRRYREALGNRLNGLNTDLAALESLRDWYRMVRSQYGLGFGRKVALGEAILHFPVDLARSVRVFSEQVLQPQLDELLENLINLREIFTQSTGLHDDTTPLVGQNGVIASLLESLKEALLACEPIAIDNAASVGDLISLSDSLGKFRDGVNSWESGDVDNRLFQGRLTLQHGLHVDNSTSLLIIHNTLAIATYMDIKMRNEKIKQHVYDKPERDTFIALQETYNQLRIAVDKHECKYQNFANLVKLNAKGWMSESKDNLGKLASRNAQALDNSDMLTNWINYVRERDQITNAGFASLANKVESGEIQIKKAEDAYYAGVFDFLARDIFREVPTMKRFSGTRQCSLQDQFKECDIKLKKLQSELVAWKIDDQAEIPPGTRIGPVGNYTEQVLLEHEVGKKTRHIPIRQLLDRASGALIALKPCFMMGPMSVAQYLAPGKIQFDMVIMDEASQIKPEDALGAIARGKQLVVVGDPKQLPPTNFFNRLDEDGDENEDDLATIQESESILDIASFMFSTKRRLRWHYRSQHESLIGFSNQSFYDSHLVIFPSPHKESSKYGIKYNRVSNGCFIGNKNMEEARAISEVVREHYRTQSEESIGVVAMNSPQRTQIESAIESLSKEDRLFREQLESRAIEDEPLFIKNLENVQGDERDVIIISMTYGPKEPDGQVYQRFGPINQDVGWRRLNVLFTRAKRRMHIFSSMGSENVITSPNSKRGVLALHNFLAFCETGILHRTERGTGRPPDSDFEIAVMQELTAAGFECEPQVGVDGFFIDLAVLDPDRPGHFLMGIECDGATYHSAKSTRDRDRLRQEQLERLGWKIRRIWSTDWYQNPRGQLNPIIRELQELRGVARP